MAKHRVSVFVAALALAGGLGSSSVALGESGTNKGNTPQGRPFQHIQGQISALQEKLAAVQAQVKAIEQRLQVQIDDIRSRIVSLEGGMGPLRDRVQSVEQAVGLLQNRVAANEESIVALKNAVSALEGELDTLRGQVGQNSEDIALLDAQITSVGNSIRDHGLRISSLEDEIALARDFLAAMVNSSCVAGQAARAVSPNGILVCTSIGGGGGGSGTLHTVRQLALFDLPPSTGKFMEVSCGNPADRLTGGGYSRVFAPEFELIPYVSALVPATTSSLKHNPIYVARDSAVSDAALQTYHVHVRYLPNVVTPLMPAALFAVQAICHRVQ
jgi:hypothetical protein